MLEGVKAKLEVDDLSNLLYMKEDEFVEALRDKSISRKEFFLANLENQESIQEVNLRMLKHNALSDKDAPYFKWTVTFKEEELEKLIKSRKNWMKNYQQAPDSSSESFTKDEVDSLILPDSLKLLFLGGFIDKKTYLKRAIAINKGTIVYEEKLDELGRNSIQYITERLNECKERVKYQEALLALVENMGGEDDEISKLIKLSNTTKLQLQYESKMAHLELLRSKLESKKIGIKALGYDSD